MKRYIKSSNTIEEYKNYSIEDIGGEYQVSELGTDYIIDTVPSRSDAIELIDGILSAKLDQDRYYDSLHRRSKSAIPDFLDLRDIRTDDRGFIPHDATMSNPSKKGSRMYVTEERLRSMLESFNDHNGVALDVRDTDFGFRIYSKV